MNDALTPQERLLRVALILLALMDVVYIAVYLALGLDGKATFPFVANSVTKDVFFLALSLIAIANIRRFAWLTLLVILGHVLLVLTLSLMLLTRNTDMAPVDLWGVVTLQPKPFARSWLASNVIIVPLLSLLYLNAQRARHHLKYLTSFEWGTVKALAEVLIKSDDRKMTPEEIAEKVDAYLYRFKAKGKSKVRVALWILTVYPILTRGVPFGAMEPDARLAFVKKRFMTEGAWVIGRAYRRFLQVIIGAAAQLVYLAYYGDKRTFESVGYRPFTQRPEYDPNLDVDDPNRLRVSADKPADIHSDTIHADVVIVGSGAAGAILAFEMAARGNSVVVLERGQHIDPFEFNENELEMLSDLYSDGAIQLARDLRFAVLQGMCVGGSTVVNNAVSFNPPPDVLHRWNEPDGLNAALDLPKLNASVNHIRRWLFINSQAGGIFTDAALKFREGADAVGLQDRVAVVEANIVECLGCGYCNIGCKWGRKLSMLDTVLPWAQKHFPDKVRVVSECEARRIEIVGDTAKAVRCRLSDGRKLRVQANERVIVSAGAIASSRLLQKSGIGGSIVGKHLCFNMATPMTADFGGQPTRGPFAGLQMSHYVRPPQGAGYVLETWFNPPGMQSLFMPGWFEDHFHNMSRYSRMASAGVVVGSRRTGDVGFKLRGPFGFKVNRDDLETMIEGMKLLGRMYFEAGAERVMPATFRYQPFTNADQLADLDGYLDDRPGLSIYSAHPQGGNPISPNPTKGVVDEDFRVHGYENLHVCDASVFPSSVTVNPQLTVMALAHYGAGRMGGPGPNNGDQQAEDWADQWLTGVPGGGQPPVPPPVQPGNGQPAESGAVPETVP